MQGCQTVLSFEVEKLGLYKNFLECFTAIKEKSRETMRSGLPIGQIVAFNATPESLELIQHRHARQLVSKIPCKRLTIFRGLVSNDIASRSGQSLDRRGQLMLQNPDMTHPCPASTMKDIFTLPALIPRD